MPGGQLREAGGGRALVGLGEALQQCCGGGVVGGWLAGVAGPGQLGAVGLHPHAQGVDGRGVAGVGLDLGYGLGHQLLGLVQVAAPQRQLGQASEQRAGPLGHGDRGGEQAPDGLQPRLGGVQVAKAQLQRGPGQRQVNRGGIRWGGLQGLAGDLLGLLPAAQGDQRLGGVGGQHRPVGAGQAQAAGLLDAVQGDRGRLAPGGRPPAARRSG